MSTISCIFNGLWPQRHPIYHTQCMYPTLTIVSLCYHGQIVIGTATYHYFVNCTRTFLYSNSETAIEVIQPICCVNSARIGCPSASFDSSASSSSVISRIGARQNIPCSNCIFLNFRWARIQGSVGETKKELKFDLKLHPYSLQTLINVVMNLY